MAIFKLCMYYLIFNKFCLLLGLSFCQTPSTTDVCSNSLTVHRSDEARKMQRMLQQNKCAKLLTYESGPSLSPLSLQVPSTVRKAFKPPSITKLKNWRIFFILSSKEANLAYLYFFQHSWKISSKLFTFRIFIICASQYFCFCFVDIKTVTKSIFHVNSQMVLSKFSFDRMILNHIQLSAHHFNESTVLITFHQNLKNVFSFFLVSCLTQNSSFVFCSILFRHF